MSESVQIELFPLGKTLTITRGTSLADVLFAEGVEFPCGGRGRCKGCRIRVVSGDLPITEEDQRFLASAELSEGWRLACRARAESNLTLQLAQWEPTILSDDSHFAFQPREGWGVAVDLGTTTIVAQLLDLSVGRVLGVRTALNNQAQHGADIMSRIDFAAKPGGQSTLQRIVRQQIGELIQTLLRAQGAGAKPVRDVVVVGNTVMHHLFSGIDVEPLSHVPFEPVSDGLQTFSAAELGWSGNADGFSAELISKATVRFLPCLGGFVGSDILAGILAVGLHENKALTALIDLGTNGEMVVGNRERMLCASTAAGPAFEGARISMGMRAATGAISEVSWQEGQFRCRVLGGVEPRGICGSGLVDAVAAGLEARAIQDSGKLTDGAPLTLGAPVVLNQKDIRELQLAKGAISAGMRILLQQFGATMNDVTRVYLAGAFGNYISRSSARRIGLLNFPMEKIEPAGNTALRGAKLALFDSSDQPGEYAGLRQTTEHVPLHEDMQFQDIFVEEMQFPKAV